jgi:putative cardiolipin synthase
MEAVWQHDTAPDHSFEVRLTPDGTLQWRASDDGRTLTYDRDPEASFWRRLTARVVGWLPLESQL